MSYVVTLAPCLLCGRGTIETEVHDTPTWQNQFRILYFDEEAFSITGVGYLSEQDFVWIAPPDYHVRWDDEGYEPSEDHRIGVGREPPVQGRWGFAFHEACWSILEVAVAPRSMPLKRLFLLCSSFPIPRDSYSPNWGHGYGGFEEHPEISLCVEVDDEYTSHHRLCVSQITQLDPFHIPDLDEPSVAPTEVMPQLGFTPVQFFDPFASLPQQLRMYIAALLPTCDFLTMRLASPFFTPMFYQQRFWATRFGPGSERSWVFESRGWDWATDWRRVYRLTSLANRSQAMHNRERVWLLALHIEMLVAPRFINPESTMALTTEPHQLRTAAVDIRNWDDDEPYRHFSDGCVTIYESGEVTLPPLIDRIYFYLSWVGKVQYVVGMKVVGMCGAIVELGYMAQEMAVPVCGKHLTGFHLALSPTGIRAVQCVFEDGIDAAWIGSLADASHTRALVSTGRLSAISADFDGCRITSLSVAASSWGTASLRDTAVWKEGIPDQTLQLNAAAFSTMYEDDDTYDPVHWNVFGGTKGQRLRYLTGINAYVTRTPCLLVFDYVDNSEALGVFPDAGFLQRQDFPINGPGGERISGVELYVLDEELHSFKIFTNWGRSHHFCFERDSDRRAVTVVPVPVPAGETITGFYMTMSDDDDCIIALGVITEMLG